MNKCTALTVFLFLLGGCAVDPLEDRNPIENPTDDTGNPEAIRAWLWAYGEQPDSLAVYHTIDKQCWESFHVAIDPGSGVYHAGLIGGGIYPTLWFLSPNGLSAFTNGILDHGDHGHIVRPQTHVQPTMGNDFIISDISVSPEGERIFVCGENQASPHDSGEIVSIQNLTGQAARYSCPGPVSYLVAGSSAILAGNKHSTTATILQIDNSDSGRAVATDTLVSDGIYHDATGTVFLAGKDKLLAIDMLNTAVLQTIDYNEHGRITQLLASQKSDLALGLYDPGAGPGDRVSVIDLENRVLDQHTVSGASFPKDIQNGTAAISNNGDVAVLADLAQPILYRITLASGAIEQATAPDAACPVACNWDGSRVWALARSKAYQVSFTKNAFVDSISVPVETSWITVSSFRDNSTLFDSNDHTF